MKKLRHLSKEDIKEMGRIGKELEHFQKTGIPRCQICHKNFVNGIDSITKKKSKYIWVSNCEHAKNIQLMIG